MGKPFCGDMRSALPGHVYQVAQSDETQQNGFE